MDMPKISIIIPIYNGEDYLRDSLNSVAAQTLKDIEVICVNDGSTDGTADILREYSEKDSRFHIIDNGKNKGRLLSRKAGAEAARGEYCQFLDSDDELTPECCETVYKLIREQGVDIVQFTFLTREHRNDGSVIDHPAYAPEPIDRTEHVMDFLFLGKNYGATTWNKLYRTAIVKTAYAAMDDFHENVGQDLYATFYIGYFAKSLRSAATAPLYIYHYGRGVCKSGTMSLDTFRLWCRTNELCRSMKQFLENQSAWKEKQLYWQALTDRYKSDCSRDYLLRTPDGDEEAAIEILLSCWDGLYSERELTKLLLVMLKNERAWSRELVNAKEWYLEQIEFKDARISELENLKAEYDKFGKEIDGLRQSLKREIEKPWYKKIFHGSR